MSSIDYSRQRSTAPLHLRVDGRGMVSDSIPSRFGRTTATTVRAQRMAKPYEKKAALGNSDEKWTHDLFDADSNLYGPKINWSPLLNAPQPTFSKPSPSPSLRPFGSSVSTPTSTTKPNAQNSASSPAALFRVPKSTNTNLQRTSLLSGSQQASASATQPTVASLQPSSFSSSRTDQPASSGLSLLSRIQLGPNRAPLFQNNSSQPRAPKPISLPSSHITHNPSAQATTLQVTAIEAKIQQAYEEAMARYLHGPVILEVANLADGTSAEDVKTAFAGFGHIQECTTEEGLRQANQPTLRARMVFTNKCDAEKAVEALNGALADGLTLAVKIVGRPIKKPEKSDFAQQFSKPNLTADVVMEAGGATEHVAMDEDTAATIVPTGRLRSEVVAQCDPRASLQSEPQPAPVYQAPFEPVQDILNRVRPLSSRGMSNRRQPGTNRNTNNNRNLISKPAHTTNSSLSLLARIHPN